MVNTTRNITTAIILALTCALGCGGDKAKTTTEPDNPPPEPLSLDWLLADEASMPTEGDPNDHYLGHGNLFAGSASYDQGILYVEPVVEMAPPGGTGRGTYRILRTGKDMETEFAARRTPTSCCPTTGLARPPVGHGHHLRLHLGGREPFRGR